MVTSRITMARLDLLRPFPLAFGTLDHLDRVFVILEEDGRTGVGEAALDFPFSPYDAWDTYVVLARALGRKASRDELFRKARRLAEEPMKKAAACALDMATLDLEARKSGRSYEATLGGIVRDRLEPVESLGFAPEQELLRGLHDAWRRGDLPKVKLGTNVEEDVSRLRTACNAARASRQAVAFDANGHYPFEQALLLIKAADPFQEAIAFLEQPTRRSEGVSALIDIADIASFPIVADESFMDEASGLALAAGNVALNYKLSRLGGPSKTVALEKRFQEVLGFTPPGFVGGTFGSQIHRRADQAVFRVLAGAILPGDAATEADRYFQAAIAAPSGTDSGLGLRMNPDTLRSLTVDDPESVFRARRSDPQYARLYEQVTGRNWNWNL